MTTALTPNGSASRPPGRRFGRMIGGVLVVVSLVAAACAWGLDAAAVPMTSLIPKESWAVASADALWWWKLSEPVRNQQAVEEQLVKAEKEANIDVETDVLPWVGNIGVALTGKSTDKDPNAVFFIEVRDWTKALDLFTRLKNQNAGKPNADSWSDRIYSGTHIYTLKDAKGKVTMQATMVGQWLVLGAPSGAEQVIDVAQGKHPSIQQAPGWASAFAHLPQNAVLWGGINVADSAAASTAKLPPGTPKVKAGSALTDSIVGLAFTDLGKGIQIDSVNVPLTPHARNVWSDLAHGSAPISEASLKQIPDDATVTLVMNNPARWYQRMMLVVSDGMSPKELHEFQHDQKDMKPLADILADYTGDTSVSLIAPSFAKLGVIIAADGFTAQGAQNRSTRLAASLRKLGVSLYKAGPVWNVKVPGPPDPSGPELSPAFGASGTTVRIASSARLLGASAGSTPIVLPDSVKNSDALALGNFAWLQTIMHETGQMPDMSKDKFYGVVKQIVDGSKLETAQWYSASKWSLDGSTQQSSFVIQNWDWRASFANTVNVIAADPTALIPAPDEKKSDK